MSPKPAVEASWLDDEATFRNLSVEFLGKLGYEVSTAVDGAEAIRMYLTANETNCPFDAVILDLDIFNGVGGREAIRVLRRFDPEVTVIVASGQPKNPVMTHYKRFGFSGALCKPFQLNELTALLDELISRS